MLGLLCQVIFFKCMVFVRAHLVTAGLRFSVFEMDPIAGRRLTISKWKMTWADIRYLIWRLIPNPAMDYLQCNSAPLFCSVIGLVGKCKCSTNNLPEVLVV